MKRMTKTQFERLLAASADYPVRIYTFQAGTALEEARRTGILTGSDAHAAYPEPYSWIHERMADQLPGFSGRLPVWGWLRRPDGRAKMLDDTPNMVRITAIVPRGRMLISDLELWNCVLNESPVNLSEAENDRHEADWPIRPNARHPDHDAYQKAVRATWTRIFDPLAPANRDIWGDRSTMSLQACIDGVRLDEIVSVRRYDR